MDAKITLSFDADVIDRAKRYAEEQNMSLSRLTEYLYSKITKGNYASIEDLPLSDWIGMVAEEKAEYTIARKKRKKQSAEYFESQKRK